MVNLSVAVIKLSSNYTVFYLGKQIYNTGMLANRKEEVRFARICRATEEIPLIRDRYPDNESFLGQ